MVELRDENMTSVCTMPKVGFETRLSNDGSWVSRPDLGCPKCGASAKASPQFFFRTSGFADLSFYLIVKCPSCGTFEYKDEICDLP